MHPRTAYHNPFSGANCFSKSNPFNPTTIKNYSIPKQSKVTLKLFDMLDREILIISRGNYEIRFHGSKLTSGIYFYRLQADELLKLKR